MQSPHFDVSAYHGAVYASSPVYETGTFRLHHSGYVADSEATCYSGYVSPGIQSLQGYTYRDPVAYTDAGSFYYSTGAPSNFENANSYKIQHGHSGVTECTNIATMTQPEDNFLFKPQDTAVLTNLQNVYGSNSSHNNNNNNNSNHNNNNININSNDSQVHQARHYHVSASLHHKHHRSFDTIPDDASLSKFIPTASGVCEQRPMKLEPLKRENSPADKILSNSSSHPTLSTVSRHSEQDFNSTIQYATPANEQLQLTRPALSESTATLPKCSPEAYIHKDAIDDKKEEESSDSKPTMSYIALIAKAILESEQKRLNLGSIYNWIESKYPFYKNKGQGWRNSVRHNLSLNDCFIKAGRCEDGKGNYWAIHPANIQDFMRGDFRQRRRSRRRGRKKDCDVSMYPVSNGYLQSSGSALTPGMTFNQTALSSIYSPYTEAERRAYRLDEALLRQSVNNPFVKWYQQGVSTPGYGVPASSHSCSTGIYPNSGALQWPQAYSDANTQSVYPALNSTFSR